jgi:SSS family solute:Na+ symporter
VPPLAAKVGLVAGFAAIALGYFVFPGAVAAMHEFHFLGAVFAALVVIVLAIYVIFADFSVL